jgi:outer membrane protein TolC
MAKRKSTAALKLIPSSAPGTGFRLTVDQINRTHEALDNATALVDMVRWYAAAQDTLGNLYGVRKKVIEMLGDTAPTLNIPGDLPDGTVTSLLYRATADIYDAQQQIEAAEKGGAA